MVTLRSALLAPVALVLAACGGEPDVVRSCGHVRPPAPVIVLESDRPASGASALGVLGEDGCFVEVPALELGADPTLSDARGRLFACARDLGVVYEIGLRDEVEGVRPTLGAPITASAPGEGAPNPWDVDVDDEGRLWIARYDLASVGVVDASGAWLGAVDLSAYADGDGLPEVAAVRARGGRVHAVVERLDRARGYAPAGPGLVVTIDPSAREAIGTIELAGANPFGAAADDASAPAAVTIATPGSHDEVSADDGVERVDLEAGWATRLVSEIDLGGSAVAALVLGEREAYAIVEGPVARVNPTSLVRFDPTTGSVGATLAAADTFAFSGLAVIGPYVAIGDRGRSAPRLRLFDRETGGEAASIPMGLYPPVALAAHGDR